MSEPTNTDPPFPDPTKWSVEPSNDLRPSDPGDAKAYNDAYVAKLRAADARWKARAAEQE